LSYAISGFRREADENCALLGCYSGQHIGTVFKGQKKSKKNPRFFTFEDGTDTLSRNVGKELPLLAA
jgi:hypothetical protein